MSKSKATIAAEQAEAREAIERLRSIFPIGSTVHTVLRNVSSSGMSRSISVLWVSSDGAIGDISFLIAQAGVAKRSKRHEGLDCGGAGMDMGFALVYELARALYTEQDACPGEECTHFTHNPQQMFAPLPKGTATTHSRSIFRCSGQSGCPANDHVNERGSERRAGFYAGRVHSDPGYALQHRWV